MVMFEISLFSYHMHFDNPSSTEYRCDGVCDNGSGPRRCGTPETIGEMFGSKILPDERPLSVRELARILAILDLTHVDADLKKARIKEQAYYILTTQSLVEAYLLFEKNCLHVHYFLERIRQGHLEEGDHTCCGQPAAVGRLVREALTSIRPMASPPAPV
ncbi:unnamed protein product, partial [Heligmosomoides polygyrus]|uniref:NR LBD domain-containing protein n=1 Tax=Heligmosomoides polygyrus TaxID=6339 RepID=A0A183FBU1_HELPZ